MESPREYKHSELTDKILNVFYEVYNEFTKRHFQPNYKVHEVD